MNESDFRHKQKQLHYAAGAYIASIISPSLATKGAIEEVTAGMLARNEGKMTYYDKEHSVNENTEMVISEALYSPEIAQENEQWLQQIKELCEKYGSQLVLVKIPNQTYPQQSLTAWTSVKSKTVRELANKYNLPFYDLYDYDLVDFLTDTMDAGTHLNIRGGEKITVAIEPFLQKYIPIPSKPNAVFDRMLENYRVVSKIAMLQSEVNFDSYIDFLDSNLKDWTIFIAGSDAFTRSLTERDYAKLENCLGLQMINKAGDTDSYIAVIKNGEVVYEAFSNRCISHLLSVNDLPVNITASGWYSGPIASIKVDNIEHAINVRGLNFVVFDNLSGLIIDSVAFNTYESSRPASRNMVRENSYLRAYESKVCFSQ